MTKVDLTQRPFVITTNTSAFTAQSLILATGADSRWLGVAGEEDFKGGGVSSCATCDGFLFSGKPVVVVGGGDTAMEDALVSLALVRPVVVTHCCDPLFPTCQHPHCSHSSRGDLFEFLAQTHFPHMSHTPFSHIPEFYYFCRCSRAPRRVSCSSTGATPSARPRCVIGIMNEDVFTRDQHATQSAHESSARHHGMSKKQTSTS